MAIQREQVIDALSEMVMQRWNGGWDSFLLTFLFDPIAGPTHVVDSRMARTLEKIYTRLLTRLVRNPRNKPAASLPLWIAAPDMPVPKRHSVERLSVPHNDGLHYHAICLLPPRTRLKEPFEVYLKRVSSSICDASILQAIDVRPITHTPSNAAEYVFKGIVRGRIGPEDLIILPRATSELTSATNRRPQASRGKSEAYNLEADGLISRAFRKGD